MREDEQGPAGQTSRTSDSPFRVLPSVAALAAEMRASGRTGLADEALAAAVQRFIEDERAAIRRGSRPTRAEVVERARAAIDALERPRLQRVLNATGVVIHTNLGRAPVSPETAAAMAEAAGGFVALEIEPETNERGGRMDEIGALMRLLTGAEATLVVNNNAAAVLLVLSAVAAGRSVVLSRGEAVEIGGGFRVPDVMRQSGANLVEVGTTNRTYARDYAAAIDETTAALLKVHPSNFRISGFVHEATVAELAGIAAERDLPVLEDLGSGALLDTRRFGLGAERTIAQSLREGAAVAMASGDKLLGGPQAGLIVGERRWVERIERHPLARAVRADKTCLAGIAATLRHYARGEAETKIPTWRMIAASATELAKRAEGVAARLRAAGSTAEVLPSVGAIGGGSLPGQTLPGYAVALTDAPSGVEELARRLRVGAPRVFGRIEGDTLLLDLRTVLPEDDDLLAETVAAAVSRGEGRP